jgi:hypothetical protein
MTDDAAAAESVAEAAFARGGRRCRHRPHACGTISGTCDWYTPSMELPLRVEIAKLSHLHIIEFLLPLLPGIVISTGLSLSNSTLAQQFWANPIGYKTKLAIAFALTYVSGLALLAIVGTLDVVVLGFLDDNKTASPWRNGYWQRLAREYVGEGLSPDSARYSTAELEEFAKYVTKDRDKDLRLLAHRESVDKMERILEDFAKVKEQLTRISHRF